MYNALVCVCLTLFQPPLYQSCMYKDCTTSEIVLRVHLHMFCVGVSVFIGECLVGNQACSVVCRSSGSGYMLQYAGLHIGIIILLVVTSSEDT